MYVLLAVSSVISFLLIKGFEKLIGRPIVGYDSRLARSAMYLIYMFTILTIHFTLYYFLFEVLNLADF